MKKTLWTLNVGDYAPQITAITYPFLKLYAEKIGADFRVITDRRFPNFPVTYEKLQIHELGRNSDWNYYFDGDVLVHPDFFDPADHLHKDTVMHNAYDLAGNRWHYDHFFRRDGRHIGSCNWFAVASDWCLDLWRPLDDLTCAEAVQRIRPINAEIRSGVTPAHLIDDYALSRNIARFGLKFLSLKQLVQDLKRPADDYLWHVYTLPEETKLIQLRGMLKQWNLWNLL